MKNFKQSLLFAALLLGACEQEIPKLTDICDIDPSQCPAVPGSNCTPGASAGSASFTKYVSLGNSLTAGFQANALFNEGQANSYAKILATQFACVGGGAFNQPDINSVNGYNAAYSNPGAGVIRGRLVLYDADGAGPGGPLPTAAGSAGLKAPFNTADLIGAYTGDKAALNNFGVPGIILGQILTPLTGGPSTGNAAYNPYYARFASNPGTSTILGDALATAPTFFSFWLGNNDVLGYATTGGDGTIPMTSQAAFEGQYNAAINTILGSNANLKGVVATIPNVVTIPFFTTVKYNAIPLTQESVTSLTAGFAGFNQVISAIQGNAALMTNFGLNTDDLQARKVTYTVSSTNPILINDESLTDLGGVFDYLLSIGQIPTPELRAALAVYEQSRPAKSTDLICLPAGSVLGTLVGGNPAAVNGVSIPLADKYVLIPTEINEIVDRVSTYNTFIRGLADGSNRLALADVNVSLTTLVTQRLQFIDGVNLTPNFAPPTGIFSEDGVHPNNRGSAYIANIFIDGINAEFGATVPKVKLSRFSGTLLPQTP